MQGFLILLMGFVFQIFQNGFQSDPAYAVGSLRSRPGVFLQILPVDQHLPVKTIDPGKGSPKLMEDYFDFSDKIHIIAC